MGRYRAHCLAHLRDLPRAGHPVTLTADHLAAVQALLAQGRERLDRGAACRLVGHTT